MKNVNKTTKYLIIALIIVLAIIILAECDAESRLKNADTSAADAAETTDVLPTEPETTVRPDITDAPAET